MTSRRTPTQAAATPARAAPSARDELLRHATAMFAAKGFAAASTREICDAAGVNLASISYYFGDKEGLYREVLQRPIAEMTTAFGAFNDPALRFEDAMRMFLAPFVTLSGCTADAALEAEVMKLHLREMMEPSPAFREIVQKHVLPAHQALCALLTRHCGLARVDDDIHQLGFALVAMAHDYCMSREFMKMLAPGVLDRPQASERILDRLVGYARALLDAEIARRRTDAGPAARRRTTPSRAADRGTTRSTATRSAKARSTEARSTEMRSTDARAATGSAPQKARHASVKTPTRRTR